MPDMEDLQHLSDGELAGLAKALRAEALRGVREARAPAHLYESELRRRRGRTPPADAGALDLRPLDARTIRPHWWAFW
jgi:hypothetical protein